MGIFFSLISNLTMADLPSVRIYDLYRNTSRYVNSSVSEAEERYESIITLTDTANEDRVSQIEMSLNITSKTLTDLSDHLDSITVWRNGESF